MLGIVAYYVFNVFNHCRHKAKGRFIGSSSFGMGIHLM